MSGRVGYVLLVGGLMVILYGLLGGPTAEAPLIAAGLVVLALGGLLVRRANA